MIGGPLPPEHSGEVAALLSSFDALCAPQGTALLMVEDTSRIVRANASARRLFREDRLLEGERLLDRVVDPADLVSYLTQCSRSREPLPGALSWIGPSDERRAGLDINCHGFVVRPRSASQTALILLSCRERSEAVARFVALDEKIADLGREVQTRRTAQLELERSYDLLRAVIEGTGDQISVKGPDGRVILANSAAATAFGVPASVTLGMSGSTIVDQLDDVDRKVLETGKAESFEESKSLGQSVQTFHTTKFACRDAGGSSVGVVTVARDVSNFRKLERQLWQAQKMEAIGRLAGGIAHDFNNLMTVVTGYAAVVLERLNPDDPLHEDVQEILGAGERAASLTRQLLAFSRKQIFQASEVELNSIITGMERMLRHLLGEKFNFEIKASPDAGHVKVDSSQIEQVVMNLVLNARDAMPRGGRLLVETLRVELDEAYCATHPEVEPGHYAMIAVIDEGMGMDERTRARLFEPFFTTKPIGRGTGLGLATVHGIVRQSGGHIWVYSELGKGTTFKIYLPIVHSVPVASEQTVRIDLPRAKGTILVVEDENGVRRLACRVLRDLGYRVLEAPDGQTAIDIVAGAQAIDLILLDVVMPEMDGPAVANKARTIRPDIPILYMSGYTENAIVHHGILDSDKPFIAKPFTSSALDLKIHTLLSAHK